MKGENLLETGSVQDILTYILRVIDPDTNINLPSIPYAREKTARTVFEMKFSFVIKKIRYQINE